MTVTDHNFEENDMKITVFGTEYEGHKHPNGGGFVRTGVDIPDDMFVGKDAKILGGTIWGGTIWGGTIRGGTILGGTIEGGTIWGGTIRGGVFTVSPSCAQRSDGYMFVAKMMEGEMRIWAGCRDFSWDEAVEHWGNQEHPHHAESMRIVSFLVAQELAE